MRKQNKKVTFDAQENLPMICEENYFVEMGINSYIFYTPRTHS